MQHGEELEARSSTMCVRGAHWDSPAHGETDRHEWTWMNAKIGRKKRAHEKMEICIEQEVAEVEDETGQSTLMGREAIQAYAKRRTDGGHNTVRGERGVLHNTYNDLCLMGACHHTESGKKTKRCDQRGWTHTDTLSVSTHLTPAFQREAHFDSFNGVSQARDP